MSKKKAPKGAFHGFAGSFFLQKKKVVFENVKHLGDKKNISLNKSELGNNMFFDVNNLFSNKESANLTGINVEFLLNLAVNTSKTKHINIGAVFGSLLGFPNFVMDDDKKVSLFLYFLISLDKKWIDPKIIKTQIEVVVKKSFVLDINLLVMENKSVMVKIQATSLVKKKKIVININLKRQSIYSDWAMVIKKIPMNMSKKIIVITVTEFDTDNRFCCAVVGFKSNKDLESAFHIEPILSIAFGGKSWAQVVLAVSVSHDSFAGSGFGSPLIDTLGSNGISFFALLNKFSLGTYLSSVECSLQLLTDWISAIVCKLSFVELIPLTVSYLFCVFVGLLAADFDMVLNNLRALSPPLFPVTVNTSILDSSSSKILTTKVGSLELKLVALEVSVGLVLVKLDLLCTSLVPSINSSSQ
ncbi:hypothetical protein G9A89_005312 [Geosiphon pyriformis]|nr:hypothetical protein G9A89_005312 [Geosiphon pyriformis]